MSRQALVKHLSSLQAAGLIAPSRSGREVRYEVVADGLAEATAWLAAVGRRWDTRLDTLGRTLRDEGTAGAGERPRPAPRDRRDTR